MAAASAVVELCTWADAKLDAATSSEFFRDDDDDGPITSSFAWPEAGRTPSTLFDQSELQALCEKHKVPSEYTPVCLDRRWVACQTPPAEGYIFVYADALAAGMTLPLHDFYVEVLAHYGLAPSQLAPDAWRYLAGFVLLSKDAGVEPSLPAFRAFFSVCTYVDGGSVGWHHFRSRPGRCLFRFNGGMVPRSPHPDWKSRFFLLRSPSTRPWPCAVRWGKPTRAAVRMPVVAGDTAMVMKKLQDTFTLFLSRQQQKHKLVKVGVAGAAAAGPTQPLTPPPTLPPPPPPPPQEEEEEPTRKRKSFSDTHTLVDCIAAALEKAKKAMAELDEKGKELEATRGEVADLKEALRAASAHHAAELRRLAADHRKAAERAAEHHKAEIAELQEKHAVTVARLEEGHATTVDRLMEEHAADVARVKDAADKELRDTKKKITLRLFPTMDVSVLERSKFEEISLLPLERPN